MKPQTSLRLLSITGFVLVVISTTVSIVGFIPDGPRQDFKTTEEQAAYQEAWERGVMRLDYQRKIHLKNTALLYMGLIIVSTGAFFTSFRIEKRSHSSMR